MLGTVAIVGRPNVGKSTLFNRIVGERISITDDRAGVTRDRIYSKAEWLGHKFNLIDTGGIDIVDAPFLEEIRAQAEIAIEEAEVIIFVCDIRTGVTDTDIFIARILQKTKKPVLLAVNRVDDNKFTENIYEFYSLGLGDPIPVSSIHGVGVGDLLDLVLENMSEKKVKEYDDDVIKFSLIGRPNVGKSSLVNAILGEDRVIVSDIEGTTMDSIDTMFKRDGKKYVVIDTAGIRKRGKIYENADKYALIRAVDAVGRSDIVLLVLDATRGIIDQDKHVASYLMEQNKACVIVVNKWDAITKDDKEMQRWIDNIRNEFKFLPYAPIAFTSALEERRIHTLFPLIEKCADSYFKRISTSILNNVLSDAQAMNPPAEFNHGVLRIYYGSQVAVNPPAFTIFVNDPAFVHFSYERYLENQVRQNFDFTGSPIKLLFRKRD
jgi:GTP-binding protein